MKLKNKMIYGLLGVLAFVPLMILIVIQSIFVLNANYDSKLVIDADEITVTQVLIFDSYNNDFNDILSTAVDDDGQPILFSIIEATDHYMFIDFHGGKIDGENVNILGIQFVTADGRKSEILSGVVYLKFKNVAMNENDVNYNRDVWIRNFIEDINIGYKVYFEQPQGTISFIWVKIIMASIGTLIGLGTVLLVILRKSTKALVKRYWRIAVLVALIEGTMILGFIAWIVTDFFQVFASATAGWILFLGAEKFAMVKGYLDTPPQSTALSADVVADVQLGVNQILEKYKR